MISFNSTFLIKIIKKTKNILRCWNYKKTKKTIWNIKHIQSHFMSTCMAIFFFLLLPPLKSLWFASCNSTLESRHVRFYEFLNFLPKKLASASRSRERGLGQVSGFDGYKRQSPSCRVKFSYTITFLLASSHLLRSLAHKSDPARALKRLTCGLRGAQIEFFSLILSFFLYALPQIFCHQFTSASRSRSRRRRHRGQR